MTTTQISKRTITFLACCIAVLFLSILLLGSDGTSFLLWWISMLVIGAAFMPVTAKLFSAFWDKGWIFSKVLGLAVSGYLNFALVRAGIFPFTAWASVVSILIPAAACIFYAVRSRKKAPERPRETDFSVDLILLEELIFLAVFLMWTYFTGYNPDALSTEKFMDYGFMAAMMRDTKLPAVDMWYASEGMNYYYGGQYFAVFLTKITGTRVNETYNLAKCLVAGFTFAMPFSICWHLFGLRRKKTVRKFGMNTAAGIIGGIAVCLAGNVHYILYGLFGGILKLSGYETYWFPSSTRYIGHNPETADSCIHEFPCYSFVLGDLHAHVVNLMFVLLFLGLLSMWLIKQEKNRFAAPAQKQPVQDLLREVFYDPYLWLFAFLIGMFQFMNYWDFAIYLVVFVITAGLLAIRQNKVHPVEAAMQFMVRLLTVFVVQFLIAVPFTSAFTTMQSGIGFSVYHSAFYQLVVLWGLPTVSVLMLFGFTIGKAVQKKTEAEGNVLKRYISGLGVSDMMALIMGFCAIGLVIAPEIVYVKDIYGDGLSRANTMFKFTYQAFVMFGMSMTYAIFRILRDTGKMAMRVLAGALLFLFLLTCAYFPYAVKCWFGNVLDRSGFRGLDATAYLSEEMPDDADAIYWLDSNVSGNPVVLETNGTSYTTNCRVSAMTGLPTVMGWYTHEWLWREDTDAQNIRIDEIEEIYTSADKERVSYLLNKYNVSYIFVGSCERDAYENLNESLLQSLGSVVYRGVNGENPAYIISVKGLNG